ncbi:MAG: hypothetical protein AAGF49_01075, partial [Pseudomonadota bacterium]
MHEAAGALQVIALDMELAAILLGVDDREGGQAVDGLAFGDQRAGLLGELLHLAESRVIEVVREVFGLQAGDVADFAFVRGLELEILLAQAGQRVEQAGLGQVIAVADADLGDGLAAGGEP